jgi:hypothetical protein
VMWCFFERSIAMVLPTIPAPNTMMFFIFENYFKVMCNC